MYSGVFLSIFMQENLIKQTLTQSAFWQVNKVLVKAFKIEAAVLLTEMIDLYFYLKDRDLLIERDGLMWFYFTSEHIEDKTTLTYRQQKTCLSNLVSVVETRLFGTPAKLHYRIDFDELADILSEKKDVKKCKSSFALSAKLDLAKAQNKDARKRKTIYKEENKELKESEENKEGEAHPVEDAQSVVNIEDVNMEVQTPIVPLPITHNDTPNLETPPVTETENIELELQVKKTVLAMIMCNTQQKEVFLMAYKGRVADATIEDVNMLADKVADDTVLQIMRTEYLDTIEKVNTHINNNKSRIGKMARAKMQQYCNSQNKRLSVIISYQGVTTAPNPFVKQGVDERSDMNSEKYCAYFDASSEFYIANERDREQAYENIQADKRNWFYNRD